MVSVWQNNANGVVGKIQAGPDRLLSLTRLGMPRIG